jgi:predicted Zn-dependent protease
MKPSDAKGSFMLNIHMRKSIKIGVAILLLSILAACATTPVTGRKQLMLVSEDQAIAASKDAYVEMLKEPQEKGKLDTDPALVKRVELITGRIITQAIKYRPETEAWDWDIHIIDEPDTVNAWAMAGGKMALYTGLVQKIKPTDDELAQVMGHEIAHALAKHSAEKMSVAMATNLAITAVAVASDQSEWALTGAALAAALAVQMPNSRQAESEADRIGIELAAKAGYDPRAAETLWRKMGEVGGGGMPEFLSTHPSPENRMKTLRDLAPKMMPYYQSKEQRPVYQFK